MADGKAGVVVAASLPRVEPHARVDPSWTAAQREPLDAAVGDLGERDEPDAGEALMLIEAPVEAGEEGEQGLAAHRGAERFGGEVAPAKPLHGQCDMLDLPPVERVPHVHRRPHSRRRRPPPFEQRVYQPDHGGARNSVLQPPSNL
eukprot:scaffold120154_cov32-Tisochrysis_lutea.AAC.1